MKRYFAVQVTETLIHSIPVSVETEITGDITDNVCISEEIVKKWLGKSYSDDWEVTDVEEVSLRSWVASHDQDYYLAELVFDDETEAVSQIPQQEVP